MLQMSRRLLGRPLRGMSVNLHMSWKKFLYAFIMFIPTKHSSLKLQFEENTALNIQLWVCCISSDFFLGIFYTNQIFPRSFFLFLPTMITMIKTENKDYIFIFRIYLSLMILRLNYYKNVIDSNFQKLP